MNHPGAAASRLLTEGIERFNAARFWDAHESWEALWLESDEPDKTFLQGLIQLTAAFHHFQRGTLGGGVRLVDAAVEKLSAYPPEYMNVGRAAAVKAAVTARDRSAEMISEARGDEPLSDEFFSKVTLSSV